MQSPLGAIAARGFAWNVGVTLLSKLVGIAAQIALAHSLTKDQFGSYAIASVVMMFATLLRDAALPQILIHRQQQLSDLVTPSFWMSCALGTLSGLIMAVAAVIFGIRDGGGDVAGLLWIAAAAAPLMSIGVVPWAILQIELRFRALAAVSALTVVASGSLSVVMALLHCGAYSLMVPLTLSMLAQSVMFFTLAPPKVRFQAEFRKWLSLIPDGTKLLLTGVGAMIVAQGDYMILGIRCDKETVGLYFFAFNLSLQVIALMSMSLSSVLTPTLAKLNAEPQRQAAAYLRACKVLAAVGMPACALQIIFARPVVIQVFGAKWTDAVLLLQILSVGMAFALVNQLCRGALQAQGRFTLQAVWSGITTVAFLALVWVGTVLSPPAGTAVGVAVFYVVLGSIGIRLVLARQGNWRDINSIFAPMILACLLAAAPICNMPWLFPSVYRGESPLWVMVGLVSCYSLVFATLYLIAIRILAREVYLELRGYLMRATGALKPNWSA
jgi:O-antigen/teichoic acid export membrane protein